MDGRFSIDFDSPPEKKPPRKRMRFEVKTHIDPFTGLLQKDVFIDDRLFEWEVDGKSWKQLANLPADLAQDVKCDILRHFCVCLSDLIGREVTPGQVVVATQTGWI